MEEGYWITLAGRRIHAVDIFEALLKVQSTRLTLPCLQGEDVTRQPGRISVMWTQEHGVMVGDGLPYAIGVEPGSVLMGWGELDGMSVILRAEECAWTVDVNAELWKAAGEWATHHLASLATSAALAAA